MKSLAFFVVWTLFFTLLFGGISWLARALDLPNASLWISLPIALFIGLLLGKKKSVAGHRKNNFDGITYVKGKGFKRQTSRFPFNLY